MIEFILSPENIPFTVAILLMFVIAFIEGIGLLLGMGVSNLIDNIFPDLGADAEFDFPDGIEEAPSLFSRFLSWLRFGKVPIIILIVVGLTSFGLTGFIIQTIIKKVLGFYWPWYLAIIPSILITLPTIRISSSIFEKILPKDETEAVSSLTFIGKVAVITLGTATKGNPAEAKLHDKLGQSHYFMVEPELENEKFEQGEEVLLVSQNGSKFIGIKNTNSKLTD